MAGNTASAPRDPEIAARLEGLQQDNPSAHAQSLDWWTEVAEALPEALTLLQTTLKDAPPTARLKAVRALAALGKQVRELPATIRSALKRSSLWDENETVRGLAAEALAATGESHQQPIAELIEALNDPHAPIRFSAAQALGERGDQSQSAVGLLLQKALRDPDGGVRLEAAMALYRIDRHAEKILPMLIKALDDQDEVRRWIAADCLGEIGPEARAALPALRKLLERDFKSPLIRTSVSLALEKIDPGR